MALSLALKATVTAPSGRRGMAPAAMHQLCISYALAMSRLFCIRLFIRLFIWHKPETSREVVSPAVALYELPGGGCPNGPATRLTRIWVCTMLPSPPRMFSREGPLRWKPAGYE